MNTTPPRTMLHASFHRTSFRAIKRSRNARCSSLSITINERAFYHPSLVTRPSIFPSLRFCVSRPPLSNYRAATIFLGELSFLFIFFLHGVERMDHSPDRNCDLSSSSIKKKRGKEREGNLRKYRFFFTSEPSLLIITLDKIYGGSDPLRPMIMSTTRVE